MNAAIANISRTSQITWHDFVQLTIIMVMMNSIQNKRGYVEKEQMNGSMLVCLYYFLCLSASPFYI